MDELRWSWHAFDELSARELYEVLALRQSVFIIEQRCLFPDADDRDARAWHLLGRTPGGALAAYLRAFPPADEGGHPSIGRVVVHGRFRGSGLGTALMQEGMRMLRERFPGQAVAVAAQRAVETFYARLGFVRTGEPFVEDGIEHVAMVCREAAAG